MTNLILIFTLISIIFIFCELSFLLLGTSESKYYIRALTSPSFERQEVDDDDDHADWFFWPASDTEEEGLVEGSGGKMISIPQSKNHSSCEFGGDISPQIKSVSYSSDGKVLNVTLWLSSSLLESNLVRNEINSTNFESDDEFQPLWKNVTFVVVMDVKSTFNEGIDYRIEFSGNQINRSQYEWRQDLYELSLDGTAKKKSTKVYDKFPSQNKYLDFSIDLLDVSNPQNYNILSYVVDSYVKAGQYCRMVDSTNWIMIPPPDFSANISPSSIELRPGDNDNPQIFIRGNPGVSETVVRLDTNFEDKRYALLNIRPNSSTITPFGNNTSILNIEIPDNLTKEQIGESKHLFIPINANISFPAAITNREGNTFSNNNSIGLTETANLTVTILPPLELADHIQLGMENATKILRPAGELWAILIPIGGVVVSVIVYILKRRKEGTSKQNT